LASLGILFGGQQSTEAEYSLHIQITE